MCSTTLDTLTQGQSGRISTVTGTADVRRRLLEMGLTPGAVVRVVRFAPLGDPIDIEVRGYHMSLRKHEASQIQLSSM